MAEQRFDPSNSPSDPPDPRNDIKPTQDFLDELKRPKITPLPNPQGAKGGHSDMNPDAAFLDGLKAFIERRYGKPPVSLPLNAVSVDFVEPGAEAQQERRENQTKDLLALKINDYGRSIYTAARILAASNVDVHDLERYDNATRLEIGRIENHALNIIFGNSSNDEPSPLVRSAAESLVAAARDLSMHTNPSQLTNMNSPAVNAKCVCRVADYLLNYSGVLEESSHVVLRFTGNTFKATIYDFGNGAKKYLLEMEIPELDKLKEPALSKTMDTIINLGDFAKMMGQIHGGKASVNVTPLCQAAVFDLEQKVA